MPADLFRAPGGQYFDGNKIIDRMVAEYTAAAQTLYAEHRLWFRSKARRLRAADIDGFYPIVAGYSRRALASQIRRELEGELGVTIDRPFLGERALQLAARDVQRALVSTSRSQLAS